MSVSPAGAYTKSRHGVFTKMLLLQSGIDATRSGLLTESADQLLTFDRQTRTSHQQKTSSADQYYSVDWRYTRTWGWARFGWGRSWGCWW